MAFQRWGDMSDPLQVLSGAPSTHPSAEAAAGSPRPAALLQKVLIAFANPYKHLGRKFWVSPGVFIQKPAIWGRPGIREKIKALPLGD